MKDCEVENWCSIKTKQSTICLVPFYFVNWGIGACQCLETIRYINRFCSGNKCNDGPCVGNEYNSLTN